VSRVESASSATDELLSASAGPGPVDRLALEVGASVLIYLFVKEDWSFIRSKATERAPEGYTKTSLSILNQRSPVYAHEGHCRVFTGKKSPQHAQ
jgi:hypothetical protein